MAVGHSEHLESICVHQCDCVLSDNILIRIKRKQINFIALSRTLALFEFERKKNFVFIWP